MTAPARMTIRRPKYGAGRYWPTDQAVVITKVEGRSLSDKYDVLVDGVKVGQLDRQMGSHPIPIKGSRQIRGYTKPRPEWRPSIDRLGRTLWYDTAGRALGSLFESLESKG